MFVRILYTSVLSVAAMFIFTKIAGNRQVSQMNLFDYISGITVGSIAADLAIDIEGEYWPALLAIAVYAAFAFFINFFSCKSAVLRNFFNGKPVILFEHNKLYEKNLLHARMDTAEFLTQCRTAGYFDLSQIDTAVLETNGHISILPKAEYRPATPSDLSLYPNQEHPCTTLVMDGNILRRNFKFCSLNRAFSWRMFSSPCATRNKRFLSARAQAHEWFIKCLNKERSLILCAPISHIVT